ncbi:MAG: nitrogen fixation protein NifM, partial [Oceanobacter sp.]
SVSQGLQAEINYRLLRIAGEQFGRTPDELDEKEIQKIRSIAINELELERLVLTSSEASQVVVDDSQLERSLAEIRERYESPEGFQDALERNQLDESDLKLALSRELHVQAVMELVASNVEPVADTDVTLYYYLHPEKFNRPETRKARHILITVNDDFAENASDQALARMHEIAKRLTKNPDRFSEQAMKHSECPTGLNGGELGDIAKGTLFPELDEALFNMTPGELSQPIQSEIGWHLLLCDEIRAPETVELASVQDTIREQLQDKQYKKAQRDWIKARVAAAKAEARG